MTQKRITLTLSKTEAAHLSTAITEARDVETNTLGRDNRSLAAVAQRLAVARVEFETPTGTDDEDEAPSEAETDDGDES
jgi:hypothetical protein